jgi:hypothetical protein
MDIKELFQGNGPNSSIGMGQYWRNKQNLQLRSNQLGFEVRITWIQVTIVTTVRIFSVKEIIFYHVPRFVPDTQSLFLNLVPWSRQVELRSMSQI